MQRDNLDLKDAVKLAVLPKQYLEGTKGGSNEALLDRLAALNIPWEPYDWQPNKRPSEFSAEIDRIVKEHYAERGLL